MTLTLGLEQNNTLLESFSYHLGEDGPSQMALEDIAMFRAVNNCHVFYPSDAVSCERAVELSANIPAMCYIRTSRPATLPVYSCDEKFEVGKGKVSLQYPHGQLMQTAETLFIWADSDASRRPSPRTLVKPHLKCYTYFHRLFLDTLGVG